MKDMAELVLASVNRTHARFKATPSDLTGVSAEVYSTGQSHDGEPTYLFARAIFERGAWTPTDVTVVVGSKALVEDKAAKVRESLAGMQRDEELSKKFERN